MLFETALQYLRRLNFAIALGAGLLLAATVLLTIVEIALRVGGRGLGIGYELSGYAMAIVASWGLAHALSERAHVRIDLLRQRVGAPGRAVFDLVALATLAVVAAVVAYHCWRLLARSFSGGSIAATPLGTPLWIPQVLWMSGWVWFALTAWLMLGCAVGLLLSRRYGIFERYLGMSSDVDAAIGEQRSLEQATKGGNK